MAHHGFDVLEYCKQQRELHGSRAAPTQFPVLACSPLKPIPPRTRFSSGRSSLPGTAGRPDTAATTTTSCGPGGGGGAAASGVERSSIRTPREPSGGASGGGGARGHTPSVFTGGRGRVARVRDGKAMLQATSASVQPMFREVMPVSVAASEAEHAAGEEAAAAAEEDEEAAAASGDETDAHLRAEFALDLMMSLNSENLASLKQQFAKYGNELDVYEFVSVMEQHLPHACLTERERVALVANLSELFAQVDVNGDEKMEWAELTSFIVEAQASSPSPSPSPEA